MRIKIPETETTAPESPAPKAPAPKPKPASPAGGPVKLKARPKAAGAAGSGPKPLTPPGAASTPPAAAGGKPASPQAVKPKSVRLKPVAVGIKRPGPDADAPAGSKRETSKIPLESATAPGLTAAPAGISANTKTIKIKPSVADNSRISAPIATAAAAAPAEPVVPDPKRQTSRISLEAALGSDGNGQADTGPKTIRLKRPSEAPTVKVKKAPEAAKSDGELRKTAQIEMPPDEPDTPATQRKTIKVKRPSQRRTVKSVSVKRGTGDQAATPAAAGGPAIASAVSAPPQDSAHWTFIVTSIAAMLICFVLIYLLCTQVLGPNISLTELAYAAPEVELPWPGRITRF